MLDLSTPQGARADKRLREELIVWLTTVRADGQPQSSPVWFLWDGQSFLHYSRPNHQKVRNITRNPRVSLHLSDNGVGGDIVTIEGRAEVLLDAVPAHQNAAYITKYLDGIRSIGMDPERFAGVYSAAIRVTPVRERVW